MRGKREDLPELGFNLRITPADAGKTDAVADLQVLREDHPRGCGENELQATTFAEISGSPPRMRGKLLLRQMFL